MLGDKFNIEVAVDAYRAKNGMEKDIQFYGGGFDYGSHPFATREQAIWWLQQQNPDRADIARAINEERMRDPNTSLEPLFQKYEEYYGQVQAVHDRTQKNLGTEQKRGGYPGPRQNVSGTRNGPETESLTPDELSIWCVNIMRLTSDIEKLSPNELEASMGCEGLLIIEKFRDSGYEITLSGSTVRVTPIQGTKNTQEGADRLSKQLNQISGMETIIAYGLVCRSPSVKECVSKNPNGDIQMCYTDTMNAGKINTALKKNPTDQRALCDKDLLRSLGSCQSILSNPDTMQKLTSGMPRINVAVWNISPEDAQRIADAIRGGTGQGTMPPTTHGSGAPASAATGSQGQGSGEAPSFDPKNPAHYLGLLGRSVGGGFSEIMNTPGAFPALMIITIGTWIFGDWKKALTVFASGVGIAALYPAYKEIEKQINKDKPAPDDPASAPPPPAPAAAPPAAAPAAAPQYTPDNTAINTAGLTGKRLDATNRIIAQQSSLRSFVEGVREDAIKTGGVYTATLPEYVRFINEALQDEKTANLINTQDFADSIFSDDKQIAFPPSSKDPKYRSINPAALKPIMMVYLTGSPHRSSADNSTNPPLKYGEKTQKDFIERYRTVLVDSNNVPNQNTTLGDLINQIN